MEGLVGISKKYRSFKRLTSRQLSNIEHSRTSRVAYGTNGNGCGSGVDTTCRDMASVFIIGESYFPMQNLLNI